MVDVCATYTSSLSQIDAGFHTEFRCGFTVVAGCLRCKILERTDRKQCLQLLICLRDHVLSTCAFTVIVLVTALIPIHEYLREAALLLRLMIGA